MNLRSLASGIGSLSDDTRRALYEYVVAQPDPVSREEAATALGLRAHKVNFHLDRLVEEGLLEVEYRRLSGRSGPGAGRPNKLYRRSDQELSISLPARQYDLVGDILATSVTRAGEGEPLTDSLAGSAREHGLEAGRAAAGRAAGGRTADAEEQGGATSIDDLARTLDEQGYESVERDDVLELRNCPFDTLAKRHAALVCGLNASYVQGVADGMGCAAADARLEPGEGRCCVRVHRKG